MKQSLKMMIFFVVTVLIPFCSAYADQTTNPASIEYVDKVFGDIQKQIDALNAQPIVLTNAEQGVKK